MKALLRVAALSAMLALVLLTPAQVKAWGYTYCWISCPDGPALIWLTQYQQCCGVPHACPSGGTGYGIEYSGDTTPPTPCAW